MKYSGKTSTGDAGEFFFGYQVAKVLGWPCRLFDIDIGIDAQVEILDDDCESTGRFVAFQIKTTSAGDASYRYVEERQVLYWQALDVPVFVASIDLSTESILLHHINKDATYEATGRGRCRIDFDGANRFGPSSGVVFRSAACGADLDAVRVHLSTIRAGANKIIEDISLFNEAHDVSILIDTMRSRQALKDELVRAETLVYRNKVGEDELVEESAALDEALGALRYAMGRAHLASDYDDARYGDGDIKRFLGEGRSISPDSRSIYPPEED